MENKRISLLKAELKLIQDEIASKQRKAEKLKKKIEQLSPKELNITDHALIRYMERELKLKVKDLKDSILTDEVVNQIKVLGGSGKFQCNNLTIVVKNYNIITIY